MTTHTRTYLEVQAKAAVDKAIAAPKLLFGLNGYKARVKGSGDSKLTLWVSDDNYCVYDVTERDQLEAQLVDDWALEQGDYDDKENGTMLDLKAALARIAEENPAAAEAAKAYLTGDENRTEQQRYRVSKAEQVRIQRAAQRKGTNASEYVRNATLKQLAQDELELGGE
jgi:hypothetical protein